MTNDERTAKLEGQIEYLATREDVANASLSTIKWIFGVGVGLLAAQVSMWAYMLSRLP